MRTINELKGWAVRTQRGQSGHRAGMLLGLVWLGLVCLSGQAYSQETHPLPSAGNGFVLLASTAGGGTVVLSPLQAVYQSNSMVAVSVVAEAGWHFLGWQGDLEGTAISNTVRMNRDKCIEAVFGTALLLDVEGDGTARRTPDFESFPYGSTCRITALPGDNYRFAGWEQAASGNDNPLEFTVTNANPVVSARFSTLPGGEASLTVPVEGEGGVTVLPQLSSSFPLGQFIQLDPIPAPGQRFLGWSGDASGTQRPLDLLIDGSKTVTATFTSTPEMSIPPCGGGMLEEGFRFSLQGRLGAVYRVEWAEDLSNWTHLGTLTNEWGRILWTDRTLTGQGQRYYRAFSIP